ncbi:MAG TPA: TfoX/Sxy family protein [Candidatus Limnocylindria bacterium]|nr:TfoX/Sxy family protein [Candidatus Limnocylindria bacterium]
MPDVPKFEKPPAELVERFEAVVGRVATPETTRRQMFGHPCAWVGGNMATGLFASHWWVRLPPEEQADKLASGEATTFQVMPGRAMNGYVVMPESVVSHDAEVEVWVGRALDYTATLPPKEPQKRKKPANR